MRPASHDRDRNGLAAPVQALDELDLFAEPELQALERAQAQLVRDGPGLLIFDPRLDSGAAMTKRLDKRVHAIASFAVDAQEVGSPRV